MFYQPTLVSRAFFDFVARKVPDSYARAFLDYLAFQGLPARDTEGGYLASQGVVHGLDYSLAKVGQKRSEVYQRLERLGPLLQPLLTFEIERYQYIRGRATVVIPNFSKALNDAVEADISARLSGAELVPLNSGCQPTRRETAELRKVYFNLGERAVEDAPINHPLRDELRRLNERPPHAFARGITDRKTQARAVARHLPATKAVRNLRILDGMIHPQVLYQAGENSPRLYTVNYGAQNMSKPVRAAFFKGAVEFDLEAAQLAVVGRIWGIDAVEEALSAGDPWAAILAPYKKHFPQVTKGKVKGILYPLVFGMRECNLEDRIRENLGLTFDDFLDPSPLLQAVWEGRERRMTEIRKEKFVTDAFGNQHGLVSWWERLGNKTLKRKNNLRSLMAYEAQSYEVALMQPAINFILSKRAYASLDLLIHDGMYVRFTDGRKERQIRDSLQAAVDERARELCIITKLAA